MAAYRDAGNTAYYANFDMRTYCVVIIIHSDTQAQKGMIIEERRSCDSCRRSCFGVAAGGEGEGFRGDHGLPAHKTRVHIEQYNRLRWEY